MHLDARLIVRVTQSASDKRESALCQFNHWLYWKKKRSQSCGLFRCGTHMWSHIIAASVARMYSIANMDLEWTHLFMCLHYSCFLSNDRCSATKHTVDCQLRSSSVLHCLFFFLSCQIRPHWPVKARKGSASCSEVVSVKHFKKIKSWGMHFKNVSSQCLFVREDSVGRKLP